MYTKGMELTAQRIVAGLRKAGLRDMTERKLLRWAAPITTVRDDTGKPARLGVIPGPRRKGRGRGKGFVFLWPREAFVIAVYLGETMRSMRENHMGRWFGHAVLRAFLLGAPIHPEVVRFYYVEALERQRRWVAKNLRQYARLAHQLRRKELSQGDDKLDAIDRWVVATSYAHKVLRAAGVSSKVRQMLGFQAYASLVGLRWSDTTQAAEDYDEAARQILPRLTGRPYESVEPLFSKTSATEEELTFFALPHEIQLARECPPEWLTSIQKMYLTRIQFLHNTIVEPKPGTSIPPNDRDRLESEVAVHTVLFALPPAAIIALLMANIAEREWGSLTPRGGWRKTETHQGREKRGTQTDLAK